MSPGCSAPAKGHRTRWGRAACPVHGVRAQRVASEPGTAPPALPLAALWERERDAEDPYASAETLVRLAGDPSSAVRYRVVQNPAAQLGVIRLLAGDEDRNVRIEVAMSPAAPHEALSRLTQDTDGGVRTRAAENPNFRPELVPAALLLDAAVLVGLARNPGTAVPLLVGFSTHETAYFRQQVARNPSLPVEPLLALMADDDHNVRFEAFDAINIRIAATTGVNESNTPALAALREQAWWEMTPESDEVALAKVLFPND